MDKVMITFFLVLCVVNSSQAYKKHEAKVFSEKKSEYSSFCDPDPEQRHDCQTRDRIPAYIWYILGFISILLLLVSILLIYVLVKTKFLHTMNVCNRKSKTLSPIKLEEGCAQNQTSETIIAGASNLDKSSSQLKNEKENNQTLIRQDSQITIACDYNTLRTPKNMEASGNISPRIMKLAVKNMPIILPEQMSSICKEVLKRTVNHGSTSSLQNIDQLVAEGKPAEETILKYDSTPASDLFDNCPTPHCDEINKTEIPVILPEQMSLICNEVLKRTVKEDLDSTLQNRNQLVKKGKDAEETVAKCDVKNSKKKDDALNKKPSTLRIDLEGIESETGFEIYDSPKTLDNTHDSNYDLPKESADKVENQQNYITPYFSANPSSSEGFIAKEGKLAYALVNDISSKKNATTSECEDKEKKDNVINENDYEFPKSNGPNQLYINANDIHTTKNSYFKE